MTTRSEGYLPVNSLRAVCFMPLFDRTFGRARLAPVMSTSGIAALFGSVRPEHCSDRQAPEHA